MADPGLLARLRELLEQQGWHPRRAEGEVARITGGRDGLRVRASYAAGSGAFLVEVASAPLRGRRRAGGRPGRERGPVVIELDPCEPGPRRGAWDDQQQDLLAASRQLAEAPVAGFTPGVAGTAARFAGAWQRHAADLADTAGERADRLRRVLADQLDTDAAQVAPLRAPAPDCRAQVAP